MANLEVYIPTAQTRNVDQQLAPRLSELTNARIALFDNQKANAPELLACVAAQLASEHPHIDIAAKSKNATTPASDELMAYLKACDAVVLAIAD